MKVTLSWLNRYLNLNVTAEELESVFPKIGLEVDSVEHTGMPPLEGIVVGEVLKRAQHPDADKLSVCEVEVGESELYTIVCGAQNFKEGDRVPVALPGARLPGGLKIKKSKLRGIASSGMMCSARELGLGEDHDGLYILKERPEVGTPINDVFSGGDIVFDLEVTANRGDCLNHIGIARELGAYYGLKLTLPGVKSGRSLVNAATDADLLKEVKVDSPSCPYYTVWSIKGVKVSSSPEWLRKDLEAVGLRPINNIVDITNFVLMETGQPLHAFDANKIEGKQLIVRQARDEEKIRTLDDKDRVLSSGMMVVADVEKPLVVAGVMGSLDAEVDDSTVDIVLESAYFDPGAVRSTARKLDLSTDSSYRFERDVDPEMVTYGARRAVDLILELAGGELVGNNIVLGEKPRGSRSISIKPQYVRDICGFDVEDSIIKQVFERLGFEVQLSDKEWVVIVPSFRSEVERPIDLVEEFLRSYGTDKIPEVRVLAQEVSGEDDPTAVFNRKAGSFLSSKGFCECYSYSLRSGEELKKWFREDAADVFGVLNPLAQDQSHLRFSLVPSLLDGLRFNLNNGNDVRMLFELGKSYRVIDGNICELVTAAFVGLDRPKARLWREASGFDFYTVKSAALELAKMVGLVVDDADWEVVEGTNLWQEGQAAGCDKLKRRGYSLEAGMVNVGMSKEWEIDAFVYAGEIKLTSKVLEKKRSARKFETFSTFPSSHKDLSLLVDDDLFVGNVRRDLFELGIKEAKKESIHMESVDIFDIYKGKGLAEGKKSVALGMTFRSSEGTMKDQVVNRVFESIQAALKSKGYEIRSSN